MGKDERLGKKGIVLDALDQNRSVALEDYRVRIKEYQLRLLNLQRALMESKHSVVIVVEGPELAGRQIVGVFSTLDTQTFISGMEATLGIQAVESDHTIVLRTSH